MTDFTSRFEQNARMRARTDYFRWLNKYYGGTELTEMGDEPEPVNLRQIFVPMRIGEHDPKESDLAQPREVKEKETELSLPGQDAFNLIAKQPFICLSGLPGSGKTTLTKALIGELCGNRPSRLRTALSGTRGIAPIPIILREIPRIERIQNFEGLMQAWWQNLKEQSMQSDSLDIDRLKTSFSPHREAFPLFILLDGIDETGGPDVRKNIMEMAAHAYNAFEYRVLVTGRPNGFADLPVGIFGPGRFSGHKQATIMPESAQSNSPAVGNSGLENSGIFAAVKEFFDKDVSGSQKTLQLGSATGKIKIGATIDSISLSYNLLPLTWPQIEDFIGRWYRLRPEWEIKRIEGTRHFLEALQDENRPHLLTLARRPIFLTLMALVHCTRNEMPHGRADLYEAIVDLYLNRQERHRQLKYGVKGAVLKVWPALEKRRVLARIAYESQVRGSDTQVSRDNPDQRRIIWKVAKLRDFISAYLKERGGIGISPEDSDELLDYYLHPAGLLISPREGEINFAHLSFQEYLCAEDIQSRLSGRHFETVFRADLATRLDRSGWDEVGLLLLAIHTSRFVDGHLELLALLDLQNADQASLLVRAVCGRELALTTRQQEAWLPVLLVACLLHPFHGFAEHLKSCAALAKPGLALMRKLLGALSQGHDRVSADAQFKLLQHRARDNDLAFDWDSQHEELLARWQNPRWAEQQNAASARLSSLLYLLIGTRWGQQVDVFKPIVDASLEQALVIALSDETLLWPRQAFEDSQALPVMTDAGLLLDELLPDAGPLWKRVLNELPPDLWLLQGEAFDDLGIWIDHYYPVTVLLTIDPSETPPARTRLALGLYQAIVLSERLPLLDCWRSRSRSLSRFRSLLRSRSRSLLRSLLLSLLLSLDEFETVAQSLRDALKECAKRLDRDSPAQALEGFSLSLECFGYSHASWDWFNEQAVDPALIRRRGLKPAEPLPKSLGLFDERGVPLERQSHAAWRTLKAWLDDDDKILAFYFPKGLHGEVEKRLRADLDLLKTQPWSPQAFVAAALDSWPESETERDFSFAQAEHEMLAACRKFLDATEN